MPTAQVVALAPYAGLGYGWLGQQCGVFSGRRWVGGATGRRGEGQPLPPTSPSVSGEACDDGNVGDNDGCSGVCVFEEGFECTAQGLDFDLRGGLVCTRICDAFTSSPYCPVL